MTSDGRQCLISGRKINDKSVMDKKPDDEKNELHKRVVSECSEL